MVTVYWYSANSSWSNSTTVRKFCGIHGWPIITRSKRRRTDKSATPVLSPPQDAKARTSDLDDGELSEMDELTGRTTDRLPNQNQN
jgi:hypothetical protein